ncbi:MAG: hypothetical protein KC733_07750 [Candidatus Omnitrophica bacterium]|nr:hypothetical protein [Candidatus Omnitrophota bacterium]
MCKHLRSGGVVFVIFLLLCYPVFGHPPAKVALNYDFTNQTLHVEMRHTTNNSRKDYVRKLVVIKNEEEPIIKYYNIQTNTLQFSEDIMIPAQDGDKIAVDAYSKEGGHTFEQIIVEKDKKDEQQSEGKEEGAERSAASLYQAP